MSYRIEHALVGDTLKVVLSGSVGPDNLPTLAADVVALTRQRPAPRLLVDVRALGGDIGPVETLRLIDSYPADADSRARRVAVLETPEQALKHYFHETAARNRGRMLRHFTDTAAAVGWLGGTAT
jgi:hypothetical protein